MKRIFTLLAAVFTMAVAWGQTLMAPGSDCYVPAQKSGANAMTRDASNQVWWSNYDEDAGWPFVNIGQTGSVSVATHIPYNLLGGDGVTINGLRIFPISPAMTSTTVWVSTKLPTAGSADLESKPVALNLETFNDFTFDGSYEIPADGLYVGYTFNISNAEDNYWDRPVLCTNSVNNRDGALWVLTPGASSWEKRTGNLLVGVLIGGNVYRDLAEPLYSETAYSAVNGTASVPVTIKNHGANTITSISYTISEGGSELGSSSSSCYIPSFGSSVVNIDVPGNAQPGEYEKTVTITKVNGTANAYSNTSLNVGVTTLSYLPKPVPVMEEYTGTWCGWCPRGMVGLRLINETYGDKVVTIAVHNGDPMAFSPYQSMGPGTFPSALINRSLQVDPYSGRTQLEPALSAIVPGEISATAAWADDDNTLIDIKTRTRFGIGGSSSQFGIAYVLVADGLTGTGSSWAQANYYAGGSYADPNLQALAEMPSRITDIVYDHVAVAGWGLESGVEGSIPQSFSAGEWLNNTYQVDISSNTIIQDKSKLHLVAMIINKNTGKIVNATKTSIESPVSVTISQYGKTTFCSDKNLDFSGREDVKAYVATGYEYQGESSTIWMTRVTDVPAGTPIVVKGTASTTYEIPVKGTSAAYYKNLLVRGAGEPVNATDGAGHKNYVMSGGKFVAVGSEPSSAIGTNKCYLQLPETMNAVVTGSAQNIELSATGTGKTTYCAPVDLDFTDVDGLIAYSATGYDNSTGTIWLTRVKKVSAGEGLLLKGTKGESYTIPSVGIQSYYANMIVGNNGTAGVTINPTDGDFTNYVLSGGKFVALGASTNIPVGKAYLQIPSVALTRAADVVMPEFYDLSEEPEVISMVVSTRGIDGDGETTGIESIDNGKWIMDDDPFYNLNGQRVEKPGKGLYIKDGKKVIIR